MKGVCKTRNKPAAPGGTKYGAESRLCRPIPDAFTEQAARSAKGVRWLPRKACKPLLGEKLAYIANRRKGLDALPSLTGGWMKSALENVIRPSPLA
jgi:hypothetical protein